MKVSLRHLTLLPEAFDWKMAPKRVRFALEDCPQTARELGCLQRRLGTALRQQR